MHLAFFYLGIFMGNAKDFVKWLYGNCKYFLNNSLCINNNMCELVSVVLVVLFLYKCRMDFIFWHNLELKYVL